MDKTEKFSFGTFLAALGGVLAVWLPVLLLHLTVVLFSALITYAAARAAASWLSRRRPDMQHAALWGLLLVLVLMAAMTIGSMYLASCIFGKQLVDDTQSHGLVMELPPYHKPKWRHILRSSLMKAWDIFWRAFTVIYAGDGVLWHDMADVHGIPVVHVDEGITAGCHQRAVQQQ